MKWITLRSWIDKLRRKGFEQSEKTVKSHWIDLAEEGNVDLRIQNTVWMIRSREKYLANDYERED